MGNRFRHMNLEDLIARFPGIVVVDEAYAEYSGSDMICKVEEFDNLVVMRMFSKAYAMAALHVGYMAANRKLTDMMICVKTPYSFNTISEGATVTVVRNQEFVRMNVWMVVEQRPRLADGLRKLGSESFPSDSNFILAKSSIDHAVLVDGLKKRGIICDFSTKRKTENCVRPTVGTEEFNNILLENMAEMVEECR